GVFLDLLHEAVRGAVALGEGFRGKGGTRARAEAAGWKQPVPLSEVPEAAPFPLDTLPGCLAHFVEEVAWALNCPPDFVAVPLLGIAGGAIGNSGVVALQSSHHQSACL